jgi:hypothetical protein
MEGKVGYHPEGWGVYHIYGAQAICSAAQAKDGETSVRFRGGGWHLIEAYAKDTAFKVVAGRAYTLTFWVYVGVVSLFPMA